MLKEKVLFDTNDYLEEDYYGDIVLDELNYILEEKVNKPRGTVVQWVLLSQRSSHYGSICNNGAQGYSDLKNDNLAQAILNIETDRVVLIDNGGVLQVNFYDHDGVHMCEVKSISKSKANYYNEVIEYDSFENKLEYIKKLPSLKVKKFKK